MFDLQVSSTSGRICSQCLELLPYQLECVISLSHCTWTRLLLLFVLSILKISREKCSVLRNFWSLYDSPLHTPRSCSLLFLKAMTRIFKVRMLLTDKSLNLLFFAYVRLKMKIVSSGSISSFSLTIRIGGRLAISTFNLALPFFLQF